MSPEKLLPTPPNTHQNNSPTAKHKPFVPEMSHRTDELKVIGQSGTIYPNTLVLDSILGRPTHRLLPD